MPEDKITIEKFAANIKAKYPQYKDIDDVELANKMAAKYPQYKESVDFEVKKKGQSEPITTDSKGVAGTLLQSGEGDKNLLNLSQQPKGVGNKVDKQSQLSYIKKQISDNYDNIISKDAATINKAIYNKILEETKDPLIANQSMAYLNGLKKDKEILATESQHQSKELNPDQQVFENIRLANNEKLLGKENEFKTKLQKEEAIPTDKILNDYASYIKTKDESKYKNFENGRYNEGDKDSYEFYQDALTHQVKLRDAKFKNGLIDENTFKRSSEILKEKFKHSIDNFPEYNKEIKARAERQLSLDKSYDEYAKDLTSSNPIKQMEAQAATTYYNVIAPALGAFTKFGADVIASTGRLSSVGKSEEESNAINNLMDDFTNYFDIEKSTSIYKLPSKLKGSLYSNGDFKETALVPRVAEMFAQMSTLILGGGKIAKGLEGAGMATKTAQNLGLFTSSFMSTQNQYFIDAKDNGMTNNEAMSYSSTAATVTSLLEMISPQKYFNSKLINNKISKSVFKDIANGVDLPKALSRNLSFIVKEQFKEIGQEITQELGDKSVNYLFNKMVGTDLDTVDDIKSDDIKELVLLTGIVAGVGSSAGVKTANSLRAESFYSAMKDMDATKEMTSSEKNINDFGADNMKQAQKDVDDYKKIFDAIPDSYNEYAKAKLALNQFDKNRLEDKKADAEKIDEIISKPEVKKINNEIDIIDAEIRINADKVPTEAQFVKDYIAKAEEEADIEEVNINNATILAKKQYNKLYGNNGKNETELPNEGQDGENPLVLINQQNNLIKKQKIDGKLFTEEESNEYQKEIESNYNDGQPVFGAKNKDIRTNMFNYDEPLAQKIINEKDVRITEGMVEGEGKSSRKTYLLYVDGKIGGKFYSVSDAKSVVKIIEDNLIKPQSLPTQEVKDKVVVSGVVDVDLAEYDKKIKPTGIPLKEMDKRDFENWVGSENIADGKIKVYRGTKVNGAGLRKGDFVTTDKEYAKTYGENVTEHEIPIEQLNYFSGVKGGDAKQVGEGLGRKAQPTELVYSGKSLPTQEVKDKVVGSGVDAKTDIERRRPTSYINNSKDKKSSLETFRNEAKRDWDGISVITGDRMQNLYEGIKLFVEAYPEHKELLDKFIKKENGIIGITNNNLSFVLNTLKKQGVTTESELGSKINAKYDAELAAVEQSLPTQEVKDKVVGSGVGGDVESTDITDLRKAKTKSEVEAAILKATQSDNLKDGLDAAENVIGKAMYKAIFYSDPIRFGNELADAIEKITKKKEQSLPTQEVKSVLKENIKPVEEQTLTKEQKIKNSLLDLVYEYNQPLGREKGGKQRKKDLYTQIVKEASKQGFTPKQDRNGKLAIMNGKTKVSKTSIREVLPEHSQEDIDFAKSQIESGAIPEGKMNGEGQRWDIDLQPKEIAEAKKDILDGKSNANTIRLITAVNQARADKGYHLIDTGSRLFAPILDVKADDIEYTQEELKDIEEIQEELVADHDANFEFLTDEDQNQILNNNDGGNESTTSKNVEGTQSEVNVSDKKETEGSTGEDKKIIQNASNNLISLYKSKVSEFDKGKKVGAKEKAEQIKQFLKDNKERIKSVDGTLLSSVMKKVLTINDKNIDSVSKEIEESFKKALDKKADREAKEIQSKIKKVIKTVPKEVKGVGTSLMEINPKYLDDSNLLTETVDEYIKAVKGGGGIENVVENLKKLQDNEAKNRKSALEEKVKEEYENSTFKDTMTLDEYKEFVFNADENADLQIEEQNEGTGDGKSKVRKRIETVVDYRLQELVDKLNNTKDLTPEQRNTLKTFTDENLDIEELTVAELKALNNVITEITMYDSYNGSGGLETLIEGRKKTKNYINGMKGGVTFAKFVSGVAKNTVAFDTFFKHIAGGKGGEELQKALMGNVQMGSNVATSMSDAFNKSLDDKYRKLKDRKKSFVKMGMVQYLLQHEVGTFGEAINQDFLAKKKEIELENDLLEELSNDPKVEDGKRKAYKKLAKIRKEVFNEIFSKSANKDDAFNSMDDVEKDLVDYAIKSFSITENPLMDNHSRYNGSDLIRFENYTPTAKKPVTEISNLDLDKKDSFPTTKAKQSGTTIKRVKSPTKDADGNLKSPEDLVKIKLKSIHVLDFDLLAKQKMKEVLYDIYTLKERKVLESMMNSKDMKALFGSGLHNAVKERLSTKIHMQKGMFIDGLEDFTGVLKNVYKVIRYTKGVKLKTVDQWVKQPISIFAHSMWTIGASEVFQSHKILLEAYTSKDGMEHFRKLVAKSEIRNRTMLGESVVQGTESLIKLGLKATNLDQKLISKIYLEAFDGALQNADKLATQVSWLAKYMKDLKKAGKIKNYKEFNLKDASENVDTESLLSADALSRDINNISDYSDAPPIFSQPEKTLVREMLYSFRSFSIHMWGNNFVALRDVFNSKGLEVDKKASLKYLAGSLSSTIAFNTAKIVILKMGWDKILELFTGQEDEDEDFLELAKKIAINATADFLVGGAPGGSIVEDSSKEVMNQAYRLYIEMYKKKKYNRFKDAIIYSKEGTTLPGAFNMPVETGTAILNILIDLSKHGKMSDADYYQLGSVAATVLGEGTIDRFFAKAYTQGKKKKGSGRGTRDSGR